MDSASDRDALLVVLTTVGSPEEASRIARELVERRLAACVNILPGVHSVFRWGGRVQEEAEQLLLSKTTCERFEALCACIRELHSYELPEILALPATDVAPAYAAWVRDSV